jgi:septum site-determining protein MinC
MSISTIGVEQSSCFQFKASFLPCTILQIIRYDLKDIEQQLITTLSKVPNFFTGAPIIIDIEKIKVVETIHFSLLKHLLTMHGFIPIGIRGGSDEHKNAAHLEGLPFFPIDKLTSSHSKPTTNTPHFQPAKIVSTPIRSGMQIYAKESDLIVTSAVSPGAELFSDGHIHVYSILRGRALAGVQGNKEAKIFCRSLEAELVSIAGHYLTKEDIQALSLPEGMMQIYLNHDQIQIEAI